MSTIYDFIFLLFSIIYLPYLIARRKWHSKFRTRFGIFSEKFKDAISSQDNIWIHAVSVGEVLAIVNLIRLIKQKYPNHRVVLSTVTKTGYAVAVSQIKQADQIIFAPLDFSWIVKRYIRQLRPKIYIVTETEIWPNLFLRLNKERIPIIVINGRISPKSFRGYSAFKFLIKPALDCVAVFCMQSHRDAESLRGLGVGNKKITVTGNMKFDEVPEEIPLNTPWLSISPGNLLWIAGSTHPGEEAIVLKILKNLSSEFQHLRLLIAPRHIERSKEVLELIKHYGMTPITLSKIQNTRPIQHDEVILVDTIGQLRSFYALSKIVFLGKSLTMKGGHNIIEPAFFGNTVLVGPHMDNFHDILDIFLQNQAVIQIQNEIELESKMIDLLRHPENLVHIGQSAKKVVLNQGGATERILSFIGQILKNDIITRPAHEKNDL